MDRGDREGRYPEARLTSDCLASAACVVRSVSLNRFAVRLTRLYVAASWPLRRMASASCAGLQYRDVALIASRDKREPWLPTCGVHLRCAGSRRLTNFQRRWTNHSHQNRYLFNRSTAKESSMRILRFLCAPATVLVFALPLVAGTAHAESNKVRVGKVIGGNGFHIPSYVAMHMGYFKDEGLDARFVELTGKAQVTAALSGSVDFVPIPSGGAQAALSGASIRYVVGESLKSQWVILVAKRIKKPEDLKGKTIGYGRAGAADYDEGAAVLERFFKCTSARTTRSSRSRARAERIAALVNGDIQAALISAPRCPGAEGRAEGAAADRRLHSARRRHVLDDEGLRRQEPGDGQEIHPRHCQGRDDFRTDKPNSVAALKEHLGIKSDEEAGRDLGPAAQHVRRRIAEEAVPEIFEGRRQAMIAAQTSGRRTSRCPIRNSGWIARCWIDAQGDELRSDQARAPQLGAGEPRPFRVASRQRRSCSGRPGLVLAAFLRRRRRSKAFTRGRTGRFNLKLCRWNQNRKRAAAASGSGGPRPS